MIEQATNAGSQGDAVAAAPDSALTPKASRWRDVVRLLRPHQWVKNVLLFLPLLLAHKVGDWPRWRDVLTGFLSFSLAASSVYVVNDWRDVEADRRHHRKRDRPFASGRLPLAW